MGKILLNEYGMVSIEDCQDNTRTNLNLTILKPV